MSDEPKDWMIRWRESLANSHFHLILDIKEFRKAGNLEKALEKVKVAMDRKPDSIWHKRSAAWVYYDCLKKYAHLESLDLFKEYLSKIKDLQFAEGEELLFDRTAWLIGKMIFRLHRAVNVDYGEITDFFNIIKNFHFTKPSKAYTFVYKAFHKGHQDWNNYLTFADWWNFENFRTEDYLKEEFKGKKIMSIAEQAYIAYSKKLLEGEPADPFGQRVIDKERIQLFLPKLDVVIAKHSEYQYPPYYKAKLLLALGSDDGALSAFLPFARQRRNDFWVWGLLAEIFSEDKDMQFACYCKTLSLRALEGHLVNLRQIFSELLIDRQMYDEAKTEIQKIVETRESNQWKLPNQIAQWTEQDWFKSAMAKADNVDLYSEHINKAEEVLFQDIPEEIVVVEFVNENRGMLNFVKDYRNHGFFKYSGRIANPQIGDILKVRFNGDGKDGFYKVITAKKADTNETSDALMDFEGTLKVIPPNNVGFVNDIVVRPDIIESSKLKDGQKLNGRAVLSFNRKKNEWGWRAFELQSTE